MRQVDIRAHFVRHYIEDSTIKTQFMQSEDNDTDIVTNNTADSTYSKHKSKFMIMNFAE